MKGSRNALDEEIQWAFRASGTFQTLVSKARALASSGLLSSSPESRRVTFRKLDDFLNEGFAPLRRRTDAQLSRSGKSAAFESCYATLLPEDIFGGMAKIYRLNTIRVGIFHDEIQVERLPLQSVIRFHAFERVQERSNLDSGFVRALAEDCLDWYYAGKIADMVTEEEGFSRMTVPGPGEDGIALGHFDEAAAVPAGTLHRFSRSGETVLDLAANPLCPRLQVFDTYIAAGQARPLQKEVRQCWNSWRAHCGRNYDRGLEREIWPFRVLCPPSANDRVDGHAVRAARSFLLDPRAVMTIQNIRPEEAAEFFEARADHSEPRQLLCG